MNRKSFSKLLNGIYLLIILLFVLDGFTSVEIKSQTVKSFAYLGILLLTPILFLWNLFLLKSSKWKLLSSFVLIVIMVGIVMIGPIKLVYASAAWQTQAVLYQHAHLQVKKVEFQLQDVGALGNNRRTVEVLYITPLFMLVGSVDKNINSQIEWIKVDN